MIPNALKLYNEAQSGQDLTAQQRRHVIAYLMAMQPQIAADTQGLSQLFKVSDTLIRKDKRTIREEKASVIKEDDIGLVIADIILQFENQIRDLEKSKSATKTGTALYVKHCQVIMDIQLRMTDSLQSLGYYPKNLGTQTTKKFSFVAVVDNKDGSVQVHNEAVSPQTLEAEFVDPYEKERAALDAEFGDRPAQSALPPAPVSTDVERKNSTSESGDPKFVVDEQTGSSFCQP